MINPQGEGNESKCSHSQKGNGYKTEPIYIFPGTRDTSRATKSSSEYGGLLDKVMIGRKQNPRNTERQNIS